MDLLKIDRRSFIRRRMPAPTNGATSAYSDTANKFSRSLKVIKAKHLQAFAPQALCRWDADWQLKAGLCKTLIDLHSAASRRMRENRFCVRVSCQSRPRRREVGYVGRGGKGDARRESEQAQPLTRDK